MKTVLKLALVGSALAASSAFAVSVDPASGNGELVLYARDTVTNSTFAKGLITQVDSVATRSTIAADNAYTYGTSKISYTLPTTNLNTDTNWTSFKSAAGSDQIVWTVLAGDSQQNLNQAGAERYLMTTQVDLTQGSPNPPSNSVIRSVWAGLHGLQSDTTGVKAAGPGDGASIVQHTSDNAGWGNPNGLDALASTMFSTIGISNENVLGTAGNFYMVTSQTGGTSATGRLYSLGQIVLGTDGVLKAVAVSQVPLPAAVWLFGSGLLGLVGIGRRKQVAVTA